MAIAGRQHVDGEVVVRIGGVQQTQARGLDVGSVGGQGEFHQQHVARGGVHGQCAGHAQLTGAILAAGVGCHAESLLHVVAAHRGIGAVNGNPEGEEAGHHGGSGDADHQPHQRLREGLDGPGRL